MNFMDIIFAQAIPVIDREGSDDAVSHDNQGTPDPTAVATETGSEGGAVESVDAVRDLPTAVCLECGYEIAAADPKKQYVCPLCAGRPEYYDGLNHRNF